MARRFNSKDERIKVLEDIKEYLKEGKVFLSVTQYSETITEKELINSTI